MANLLLLLARRIAAILKAYFARVSADGGITLDRNHTKEVYADVIDYEPSLIQSCDSGKAGTLYSIIPSQELLLYQYTGAAAAYSLRSLSAGTIYVVKVRRSGDDAELDFTASQVSDGTLAAWVRAGGGTEDGFVTTWYDQSGNTNNATQATAASQPKIVSSGTLVTENGKAAVDFDGSDDFLRDTFTIGNPVTLFVTAQAQTTNKFIIDTGVGVNINSLWTTTSADQIRWLNGSGIIVSYTHGTQALFSGVSNGSSSSISVNGSITTGTLGTTAMDGVSIGVAGNDNIATHLDGTIQEIIIYASDQSANLTGIEDNINDYYNIYP